MKFGSEKAALMEVDEHFERLLHPGGRGFRRAGNDPIRYPEYHLEHHPPAIGQEGRMPVVVTNSAMPGRPGPEAPRISGRRTHE